MPNAKLTTETIHAAIEGFESQKQRIDLQIDELRQLLKGERAAAAPESEAPEPKRKMSAAGRRRIAAAQKARWAKIHGEAGGRAKSAAAPKTRKRLSAAGRKAISEANKKRWALKRAEAGKGAGKSGGKKTATTPSE